MLARLRLSLLLFALAAPAVASGTLDQEYDPTTGPAPNFSAPVTRWVHHAQTFTVGISGWLDCVEVFCEGNVTLTTDLIVDVRRTEGGAPIDEDLPIAQVAVPVSSLPTPAGFHAVDLSAFRVAVWAGETLALVVRYSGPESGPVAAVSGSTGEPYPPGAYFYRHITSQPTWETLYPGADLGFRTYVTPYVGTRYCAGDGSGAGCPCGNESTGGGGCSNSSSVGGGELDAVGLASVSANAVELHARGLVPDQPALFFQGDQRVAGGDGLPFGDGLRCAGANVVRLEVRFADPAGAAATTVDLVEQGGTAAGDLVRYQAWYRDPTGSPCGLGFNLTNGYELEWGP